MCAWAAYPEAAKICGEHLLRDQAHDVRGHLRRGLVERNFKNYGRRLTGAVVRQERNRIGSSNHVVIEIGGIRLTQSQADGPNDVVQHADFRETYAEASQIDLFDGRVSDESGSKTLFAMLLHGPSTNPKQPRFIAIVFPTKDCKAYVYDATIDVLAIFGDLAEAIRGDRTEVIGDDLMLELRRLDEDEGDTAARA